MTKRAPGPGGTLILGTLREAQDDMLGLLTRTVREYGDITRLRFGPVTAHIVNHPDYIEQVLSRNAAACDKKTRSSTAIRATCGDSLLSSNTAAWQRHRSLIQPVFQPRNFVNIDDRIDAEIAPLIDRWHAIAAAGGTVDIVPEMTRLTIAISAKILFSSNVEASTLESALTVALDDTLRRVEALFDPSLICDAFHRKAFRTARARLNEIVLGIIAARQQGTDQPDDVLSRLLRAHEAEGDIRLSDTELRDATLTLLLAGHETTATALASAMYFLGKYPEMNPDIVGVENFFAETLRLHPSIWIIERRAVTAQEIGGYCIPKGSGIYIVPYLLHRHPRLWEQPERFDPTRFAEASATRPRHAYLPFGLGPHRCVGLYMAQAIAHGVITRINSNFRLSPLPDQTPDMFHGITLRHKVNFAMQIKAI